MSLSISTLGTGFDLIEGEIPHRSLQQIAHAVACMLQTQDVNLNALSRGLAPVVNVLHFDDVDPTGDTDSTTGIQQAIDEAIASGSNTIYIPRGLYLVSTLTITSAANITILGDGDERSTSVPADQSTATILQGTGSSGDPVIHVQHCLGTKIRNLTVIANDSSALSQGRNGIQVTSVSGAGTSGTQLHNVALCYCTVAHLTGGEDNVNDAENHFHNCHFFYNGTNFKTGHSQSLAHVFVACTFDTCTTFFDLTAGGNISVFGLTGGNVGTLLSIGSGGSHVGTNLLCNLRLDCNGSFTSSRTKLYNATAMGTSRTIFLGLTITGVNADNGTTRATLRTGHQVTFINVNGGVSLGTATSPFADWVSGGSDKTRLTLVECELDLSYLYSGSPPSIAEYSCVRCYTVSGGRVLDQHYPALGLNDTITFFAAATDGGAVEILNTVTIVEGLITSWSQSTLGTPGEWQFNDTVNSAHILTCGL